MSSSTVAVGTALAGIFGMFSSSKSASKANAANLAFAKQRYSEGKEYLEGNLEAADEAFDKAVDTLSFGAGGCPSAVLATAYDAKAYDMKAFMAEAYEVELDGFIEAFKSAEDINTISMDTFNRRYGQIMENVKRSILDVEQSRLSASGREQLAIDATTLANNFDNQLVKRGMDRSGISVEMHKRMEMETAQQARAIDVNSYSQAMGLQAQGTQTLNSMTAAREGIAARGEVIAQNKAHGILSAEMQDAQAKTNVSLQNAQAKTLESQTNAANKTNVSIANARNKTNVSIANAQTASQRSLALAQLYSNKWSAANNAMNSFYTGVASDVTSANNQTAASASADAAGYAKMAGWGVELWQNAGK